MPSASLNHRHKPRELRRRVLLPTRMRVGAAWSDACILNISSRGLLIHSGRPFAEGIVVELRHGDQVIVGRVVWRQGAKAGLHAADCLPVEQILSLAHSPGLHLAAGEAKMVERRRTPRAHERSRIQSRMFEFVSIAIAAVVMSGIGFTLVGEALARPLAQVRAAFGAG